MYPAASSAWLNGIETNWSLVGRAHEIETVPANAARQNLLNRYCGAAWRYLRAATRDETVADDLFQEFALRLIRGDFRRAGQTKGRFRDYLKRVLVNLVNDYYRSRSRCRLSPPEQLAAASSSAPDENTRDDFLACWRAELLQRAWAALRTAHPTLYAVLHTQVHVHEDNGERKAQQVASQLGEPFTVNRFRVTLHRAREKFARLLVQEVAATLDSPTEADIRSELRQLCLLRYCCGSPS